jgi:eukaryotic-like serine/threonine-protein kinase
MTPERWQKLKELCHLALEREPSQRALFLAEACREDEELRQEAESLLARATLDPATLDHLPDELEARVIGHYHLLQKIGEGGMGEVWLAEQKEPVRRRVALKLVKAGMNTREVMARFESERQALALMEHPAIAKVYDAGSTNEGAPYFVMEYVAGVPITEYCDNHRLSIKERLELFMQACQGVRHAHQKAVIHRDLKPSNILVMEVDGRAGPKIIDFGVAKALSQKLTPDTIFTRVGSLVGTPEYMSPEQALSSGEDIDTRTDVYSLGIIFYELLAGAPPIELRRVAFDEYLRRLREEDPPKPSTKIRTGDAATATELARRRQTEPVALARQIGGDLDSIALKALEKDRSRRYGSASDFAADIARYLRHEAVQAVPPSAAYRARKFASRHRWGVAMGCAFAAVLTAAAAISIRQSIRANREAAVAQVVSDFLRNDVLAQAGASTQATPTTKPDPDLKVRTALDRAAQRIAGKFDNQPEVEAAIRSTIGQTYQDLGLFPQAKEQFERALELRQHVLGAKDPKTLQTVSSLGTILLKQGKLPEAEALLSQNLEMERRVLGSTHPNTLATMNNLGIVYTEEAKYRDAEALESEVLETRRRALGPENPLTLGSMTSLANAYEEDGKFDKAEPLDAQALQVERRVLGPEHPRTLGVMNSLANVYFDQGRYAEAEALYIETLDLRRRVSGPEHPDTLSSMMNLAIMYRREGKRAQAEALYSQTLEIERRTLGTEHRLTLMCMNNLANLYQDLGKLAEAEALQAEALEVKRRVLGPEHPDTLMSMHNLANTYAAEGKYTQAEPLFTQALDAQKRRLGPLHGSTLSTLSDFASMHQRQGNYTLAETNDTELLAGCRQTFGPERPKTMSAAADLALVYNLEGKSDASEPLARQAFEFYRTKQPNWWEQFWAESLLGASLAGQKKFTEAESLLLEGYQGMLARKDRINVLERSLLDQAHQWLVQMYVDWGKPEKAAEWRKK